MNHNEKYKIILFYNYTKIEDPEALMESQLNVCRKLGLKGRTIIAKEGFNATLEGSEKNIKKYLEDLLSDPRFGNTHIKYSDGSGNSFPKLSIKVRDEIVSAHLGEEDVNPAVTTGKYITPKELHSLIHSGKEFYMIDMRNDYEHKSGFFKDAILPPLKHFRDLPKVLPQLESLKNKTVVTYCTGGVRCEKASGYLVSKGFTDVYQLYGGIHAYMEEYPNEDFLGKLYVFDGRVTMGMNINSPQHVVVGKCDICGVSCDDYANCAYPRCNRHIIACNQCRNSEGKAFCSEECKNKHLSK